MSGKACAPSTRTDSADSNAIATAILSIRKVAGAACTAALARGHARMTGIDRRMVVVSSDCA
ncbi:hypothetical protein DIE23_31030 [Burkholderia sp. Bp9143]|nr:hypothetical protein DIE23_31030 [Burkholderia sp. Bp9143]